MSLYQSILKPLMFQFDAEDAHHYTMALFRLGVRFPGGASMFREKFTLDDDDLKREVMGLQFKNPVGLAAGFDKDGKYVDLLPLLGFGFAEVGTVTPQPQKGNPRPRLFRLKEDEALINRMGFNNDGVEALARRLDQRRNRDIIIGGNIGKNKDTPNEEAFKDYVTCFRNLKKLVDFFVINVSSPNTPGLRELQNRENLQKIIGNVQDINDDQIPVVLKIAPDITLDQLDDIIGVIEGTGLSGINCHNTTIRRDSLNTPATQLKVLGAGGLSGKPLNQMFATLTQEVKNRLPSGVAMMASGGVHDWWAVSEKFKAGADLVEVYTGLIYQGPEFVKKILSNLIH